MEPYAKRKLISLLVAILSAIAAAVLNYPKTTASSGSAQTQESAETIEVPVITVTDGDTLHVMYEGISQRLRLIGLDCPESEANEKALQDAHRLNMSVEALTNFGNQAKQAVKRLVHPQDNVRLEFDTEQHDKFGRLLAYVYLSDGKMLNEEILRMGYARPFIVPPNGRYAARFRAVADDARRNNIGFWPSNVLH